MAFWIGNYFLCLIMSVVLAGIIIPNIMTIAFRRKLFDEQDERKIHRGVVPRLGGISFLPAFIFSFCLVVGCNVRLGTPGMQKMLHGSMTVILFLLCALMLMYLVGIADDLIGVRYRSKFIFQILAGILIVVSGSWIPGLYGFLWINQWYTTVGWVLTVFLVIYVVNAINLIDGIDGLASGLSAIALAFYSWVFYSAGEYACFMLAGSTLGMLMSFFYYNVFGTPDRHNKIFMDDTGSLTIGIILVFLSIRIFNINPDGMEKVGNLFILAIAPIIVPCFDVVRIFFHRVRNGKNPFLPDKCHIHHKLLALGCKQWQALISILLADALFICVNLALSPFMNPTWIIVGDVALWIVMNMLLTHTIRARERSLGVKLYE